MAHNPPRRTASSPYTSSQTHTPRYTGAHSNSSAFSKNAQPNEDWTQVSDLAERRRIQNRIAQRNYRQKLKRRLEELERGSASPSASPERSPSREIEHSVGVKVGPARRRRTLDPPSVSSSARGNFDVQHLNLFGQSYDHSDSRSLGYQFCAQPSPPPPPSPPLLESTAYTGVDHSRYSLPAVTQSPWTASVQHSGYYATPLHHASTAGSSYPSSYTYSPNVSSTSTPASRSDSQYWSRGSHEDSWGSWSSTQSEHAPSHLQSWQQHDSPPWANHYNAAESKYPDDALVQWAQHGNRYPTPPRSAELVDPEVNPFDEFLNVDSK